MTALALVRIHAAQAFNGTFYATMATVIPVLFLAFAIPGGAFEEFLREALRIAHIRPAGRSPFRPVGRTGRLLARALPLSSVPRLMLLLAFLIVTSGFVGETTAIIALYQERSDGSTGITVIGATFVLLFTVVTRPLRTYILAILRMPGRPLADMSREPERMKTGRRLRVQPGAYQAAPLSAGQEDLSPAPQTGTQRGGNDTQIRICDLSEAKPRRAGRRRPGRSYRMTQVS